MFDISNISLPSVIFARLGGLGEILAQHGVTTNFSSGATFLSNTLWIGFSLFICIALPNCAEIFSSRRSVLVEKNLTIQPVPISWEPNKRWAILTSLFLTGGILSLGQVSEFLYFQF